MSSLTYDSRLSEIAAYHSRDMAANNYTGHTAPGGETVDDRFQRFAYRCDAVGELVLFTIYGQDLEYNGTTLDLGSPSNLAEGVVGVWRASPSHRGALLSESWERVGIDVAITDDGRVYVTLNAC